ncbi:MAG: DUF4465 domain-containing protein [Planctomycetia bacterium]|nr:DUF4465 domain-containing protein [Planctomycetia bacterium]
MKRIFLLGMVCLGTLWVTLADAAVCDFSGTPGMRVWHWNMMEGYGEEALEVTPATSFETHMTQNSYYWGNDQLSQEALESWDFSMTQLTYKAGDINISVKGIAEAQDWGSISYTTSGAAVSRNESSLESDIRDKGNYLLPNATYAYTKRAEEGNRFLVFYDVGHWGKVGDDFIDSFVSPVQINFDSPVVVESLDLANTLYAVNSMTLGDSYAEKYTYANDGYFGITISGLDSEGNLTGKERTFLLADFLTYADETEDVSQSFHDLTYYSSKDADGNDEGEPTEVDYLSLANGILDDWATVLLEELGLVSGLQFTLFCSDYGNLGFNTPLYFALDNLVVLSAAEVPEPGTWSLLALGLGILLWKRKTWTTVWKG